MATSLSDLEREFSNLLISDVNETGKELGRGSYGEVREAEWLGAPCATKRVHSILLPQSGSIGSSKVAADFVRECRTWKDLRHTNIVLLFGVFFERGSPLPVLVMERLSTSLRYYLETHTKEEVPQQRKATILRHVALGLAYLHRLKNVHRDLSPNNILLDTEGWRAKITDFGVSRAFVSADGRMTGTYTPGTPAFMPPEVFESPAQFSDKVDVFSLGCVTIFTLTHQWPEPGLAKRTVGGKIVGLSELERREKYLVLFSEQERDLYMPLTVSCLQEDPFNRPSSADLAERLLRIAEETRRSSTEEMSAPQEHTSCTTRSQQISEIKDKPAGQQSQSRISFHGLRLTSRLMSVTDAQLKRELTGYRYVDQTTRHIQAVLANFQSLKPGNTDYVHANGAREPMMCLSGTIPVHIAGSSYNIPVGIYLRKDYPYQCPYCQVQPTPDMIISPSKYVNQQGIIFLPYLHDWNHSRCDLTTLVQVMIATFSEKSPVFARPPTQPAQPQYQPPYGATPYPNQGYPPYPQGGSNPPYPVTSGPGQMPTPHMPSAQGYPTAQYPPTGGYQPTQSLGGVATGAAVAGTASAVLSAEEERKKKEEHEKVQRESLISAVTDRIKHQVRNALDQGEVEMSQLIVTQEKLKKGSEELNRKLQNMEDEQRKVECVVEEMRVKTAEIESVLEQLEQQPEVDVDEAVVGANVVFDQILHLYAEENAIDDTIYYLSEALRKGVISLDVFLKHVREISREQFMKRALIAKARGTAGLPERR